ncbi:helix-turn-helix domain-containing protein [soil metagenome]
MALAVPGDGTHAIMTRISERLDDIGRRMANRYREEILDYSTLDDEILYGDVAVISLDNLRALMANLERGEILSEEELDDFREGAARRVHQGIPLESLLHAYRLWGQIVWQTILETANTNLPKEREAALEMAGQVIAHIDLVSTAAAQAYLDEAQGIWTDREVIRRDLLEALISGKASSNRVRANAAALHIDLGDDYLVLLAGRMDAGHEDASERQPAAARTTLRSVVDTTKVHLHPSSGSLLVGLRHEEIVALFPIDDAEEVELIRPQAAALSLAVSSDGFAVGIGGWHPGASGIAASYAEAKEALEIALESGVRDAPVAFNDVLLDHVLKSTPKSELLLEDGLIPLREYDAGHKSALVPTLRAYFDSGFNLTKTAGILCVHPNTVVYRLRRIKEITARDPHNPSDLLLLCLGLKMLGLSQED